MRFVQGIWPPFTRVAHEHSATGRKNGGKQDRLFGYRANGTALFPQRLTPRRRKGLMRAVAQIAQSVEQGIENPHDSFHTTALVSTPYKASLSMRGLFVMRLWSISGKVAHRARD